MKLKFKRASARAYLFSFSACLFLAVFCSTVSSVGLPSDLTTPEVQETQDGRDISSKSYGGIHELLDDTTPKEYIRSRSSATLDNHDSEGNKSVENCTLAEELLQQMKSTGRSEWIIDNKTLEILDNDPQQLIQCTEPGDRVIFRLRGVQKFKRTMVVLNQLELISDPLERTKTEVEYRNSTSFTCPDSGPFLIVNATNLTANGFVVENCKESSGNGAIVIKAGSSAAFEDIEISYNDNRAIYVESHSVVELKNSYFSNDGINSLDGGVIRMTSNVFLNISNSSFFGNEAYHGGVLFAHVNNVVAIASSTFSENNANWQGGAIYLESSNTFNVQSSTMSQNNANYGGAIYLESSNTFNVQSSTMSQNKASRYGGGICLFHSYNTLNIKSSMMSQNNAGNNGGAIYLFCSYNTLKVESSTISKNKANEGGGIALFSSNSVTVKDTTLSENIGRELGGAIVLRFGNRLDITNTSFLKNRASLGGAVSVNKNGKLEIANAKFSENIASAYGGAIECSLASKLTVKSSIFEKNKANFHGGAMRLRTSCSLDLAESSLQENSAMFGGGAMFIETSVFLKISKTNLLKNNASRGGAIYAERDCNVSIGQSKVEENYAEFGGCLYGVNSAANLEDSEFPNNFAYQDGGCLCLDSSSVKFHNTAFSQNEAVESGGAIHASSRTLLSLYSITIGSNNAFNGGGIALVSDSRILCVECTFEKNTANVGGGLYIESHMQHVVSAQFDRSTFRKNKAFWHGGGMVIKTFGSRRYDCEDMDEPCSRVVLIETRFVGNVANLSSSAILATKSNSVLVVCYNWVGSFWPLRFVEPYQIREQIIEKNVKMLNDSKAPCILWRHNRLACGAFEKVIGTFGQIINVTTNSKDGPQITSNFRLAFAMDKVTSGMELPSMKITTIDAFGNTPALTLHSDALVLSNHDGFLGQSVGLSFENDTCIISNIIGFVEPGNYSLQLKPRYDDDILEGTNLTIVVRNCTINEVSTLEGKLCLACSEASYNFDLSREEACTPCPENANCSTQYITPKDGYWHKSPCHTDVKKCIVEEACNYLDRTQNLTQFTQNFTNCNFTSTTLHEYEEAQCNKGYKGCLCGSCKKSYGRTPDLECVECQSILYALGRLLVITLLLLIETGFTIKGTLVVASRRLMRQNAMSLSHEVISSISTEEGTSTQLERTFEEGSIGHQASTHEVEASLLNLLSQEAAADATQAQRTVVEVWKILINFLQVTSTAGFMDVEWTQKIITFFKILRVLGAATINAVSQPIDCILSLSSIGARAIWRYLFSLFVPTIVIVVFAVYLRHRALVKYSADTWYFWRRFVLVVITVTYITYFDITQHVVRAFSCVVVHDNSHPLSLVTKYWVADTLLECYKSDHAIIVAISIFILIIVSVGFPLACSRALFKYRNEVSISNSRKHEMLGLLCGPFKERFIYWECVTMIKKGLLSIIIVFSYSLGIQAQGLLISMVLVFFLTLHTLCLPFDEKFNILNYLESGSLMTSCITYTLVQFLTIETLSRTERSLVSIVAIILNGLFVLLLFAFIARNLIMCAKASLKSHHVIDIHDEIGWFKTIKMFSYAWWYNKLSSRRN